jgi:hypothetical protein
MAAVLRNAVVRGGASGADAPTGAPEFLSKESAGAAGMRAGSRNLKARDRTGPDRTGTGTGPDRTGPASGPDRHRTGPDRTGPDRHRRRPPVLAPGHGSGARHPLTWTVSPWGAVFLIQEDRAGERRAGR